MNHMDRDSAFWTNFALFVGRFIVVFTLIPNSLRKIATFEQTAAGMGGTPQIINGQPFPPMEPLFYFPFPEFFLGASLSFDMLGAILIILGLMTRPVAAFMSAYCVLALSIYHYQLWDEMTVRAVMRTIPMVGGLILIAGAGAGRWSLDHWLASRRKG